MFHQITRWNLSFRRQRIYMPLNYSSRCWHGSIVIEDSKFGPAIRAIHVRVSIISKRGGRTLSWGLPCTALAIRKGNFRIGLLTEKSRLRRALTRLQDQMRYLSLQEQ